jgi:hypothetical protein
LSRTCSARFARIFLIATAKTGFFRNSRLGGSFPFYDLLVKGQPDIVQPDFVAYACARNPQIGFRKLTNFAIGVFWKASIHSWREGRLHPHIELGRYRESFRKFLNHEARFPEHTHLMVAVSPPDKAVIGFNVPATKQKQPYHQYVFHIPGMVFSLGVGKGMEEEWERTCFYTHNLHPVIVADLSRGIVQSLRRGARNAVRVARNGASEMSGKFRTGSKEFTCRGIPMHRLRPLRDFPAGLADDRLRGAVSGLFLWFRSAPCEGL